LQKTRAWLLEAYPLPPRTQNTIIYYTRRGLLFGRQMDVEEETKVIELIPHRMTRFGRPEKCVLFDGQNMSMADQIGLFRSATMVSGPHGGGLVNILYMISSNNNNNYDTSTSISGNKAENDDDCSSHRPRILEFVTSPDTPEVQNHDPLSPFDLTYQTIYSTAPGVQFYRLFFVPPSNSRTTFVDLDECRSILIKMEYNIMN
jgi:hypothetical protein